MTWWYGRGWVTRWGRVLGALESTLEFFSIGQLVNTLFSPFRQISAGGTNDESFGGILRNFADQLISRIIGFFVRFFTIIFGFIVISFQVVYELLVMVLWWFLPLLPVIGAILFAIGWVPEWI